MPQLSKHTIGNFLATGCERQLALAVATDAHEEGTYGMPPKQTARPGVQLITKAGRDWEFKKVQDLEATFPAGTLAANPVQERGSGGAPTTVRYAQQELATALQHASPGQFIVEAQFDVEDTFKRAYGCGKGQPLDGLEFSALRPDLIQVRDAVSNPTGSEVRPDGSIRPYDANDPRRRLRIIDIKLTAEPSAGYFAEVAYYSIALAGWLKGRAMDRELLVSADAAVWPGSHQAAAVRVALEKAQAAGQALSDQERTEALDLDLEVVPFEVFSLWLREFFAGPLPHAVANLATWRDLRLHVDNTCRHCDWIGQKWFRGAEPDWHDDHCLLTAEREHDLSRVAFLTRGGAAVLRENGVSTVDDLAAAASTHQAFDAHQSLRAGRIVVGQRARALTTDTAGVAPGSGTSAVMPRWADLKLRVSCYFDIGSGITLAFAVDGYRGGTIAPAANSKIKPEIFVVETKSLDAERERLLAFLAFLQQYLTEARAAKPDATYQVFIWDTAQYEHLTRVIGRHLDAILDDTGVRDLAWLFPSDELAPNPTFATRQSPVTIVREAVKSLVGAPVAHYYSLLELAAVYQPASRAAKPFEFNPHPMFNDPLSDQIPSERAHEIWAKIIPRPQVGTRPAQTRDYQKVTQDLRRNIELRMIALQLVTDRLAQDLRDQLMAQAPKIELGPISNQSGFATDSHLWFAHCKLNAELQKVEVYTSRAMGVSEREARFRSARLPAQMSMTAAAAYLGSTSADLQSGTLRVYEIGPGSRDMKVKDGDIGFCLAPEADPTFVDRGVYPLKDTRGMPPLQDWQQRWRLDQVTSCTVVRFDRAAGVAVVKLDNPAMVRALEGEGVVDLSKNVVLDKVPTDHLTKKVGEALHHIGNPPLAQAANQRAASRAAARATGQSRRTRQARTSADTPAAEVLWASTTLAATPVARDQAALERALTSAGGLNESQRRAFEQALSRRLALIWGPPGTGKSHTLRVAILAALAAADAEQRPLRVLVTGPTYTAVGNVVGTDLFDLVSSAQLTAATRIASVRSSLRPNQAVVGVDDVELNWSSPSADASALLAELLGPTQSVVVGATPQQVHNLTKAANNQRGRGRVPGAQLFDLLIIDEASQVDVATSALPLIALAGGASVVVCGDDLQMPPIHAATPPAGLEDMVESIYGYLAKVGGVAPVMLETNYRSNQQIVDFVKTAGYDQLHSHSPDLRLDLVQAAPPTQPVEWPASLEFSPQLSDLLDPERSCTALLYSEGLASQWNRFEAHTTAALVRLLFGRLGDQLADERRPGEVTTTPRSGQGYGVQDFFTRGVGVVTPHRAQQSLVIRILVEAFADIPAVTEDLIRDAVDTVERYQGQQRDVIIATMALGDPDAIADEDEFLFNLRRFNVMASRARAKLIVLCTQQVAAHMPDEPDVMRDSRLLKAYLGLFCDASQPINVAWRDQQGPRVQPCTLRWHA